MGMPLAYGNFQKQLRLLRIAIGLKISRLLSFSTNQKLNQNQSHLVQFSRALSKLQVIARKSE